MASRSTCPRCAFRARLWSRPLIGARAPIVAGPGSGMLEAAFLLSLVTRPAVTPALRILIASEPRRQEDWWRKGTVQVEGKEGAILGRWGKLGHE